MDVVQKHTLKNLRDFLSNKYGIYIDDDKLITVYKRKIHKILQKFGYKDINRFYRDVLLNKNKKAIEELINTITVNETYFFREKYQFDTLIKHVIPELDKIRPSTETINILSAPCSSGEEIYSIAIYLLEEGNFIRKRDFLLLGIDIDTNAIKKAKDGIFQERSLIKLPEKIVQKYFKKEKRHYKITDYLRKSVNFKAVNILDRKSMEELGKFDVIFCRNMLIYFDEKNRKEVLSIFYEILKEEGYLFLGHAERVPEDLGFFKRIKLGESYLYKKEV